LHSLFPIRNAHPPNRDCPGNGVSGPTRRATARRERVIDDRDTGGHEPTVPTAGKPQELRSPSEEELAAARELVRAARDRGVALTGPDGLLKALTKTVVETALDEEMAEHLGYDKHAVRGRNRENSRNGKRSKTIVTEAAGEMQIEVPRDRDGTFTPQVVKKRQRRLSDLDAVVISLYSKGLTTGEISAHFAEVYGASVSKDTVSRITDRVIENMQAWTSRPLSGVYAAVFIDAIYVKVRDGQVATSRSTP
jgi:putative transposase